jgi:hypothetical protein
LVPDCDANARQDRILLVDNRAPKLGRSLLCPERRPKGGNGYTNCHAKQSHGIPPEMRPRLPRPAGRVV